MGAGGVKRGGESDGSADAHGAGALTPEGRPAVHQVDRGRGERSRLRQRQREARDRPGREAAHWADTRGFSLPIKGSPLGLPQPRALHHPPSSVSSREANWLNICRSQTPFCFSKFSDGKNNSVMRPQVKSTRCLEFSGPTLCQEREKRDRRIKGISSGKWRRRLLHSVPPRKPPRLLSS